MRLLQLTEQEVWIWRATKLKVKIQPKGFVFIELSV